MGKNDSKTKKSTKKVTEVKKDNKVVKKEEKNEVKKSNMLTVSILIIIILAILLFINLIVNGVGGTVDKKKDIKIVKKILNTKYNSISCLDKKCDYLIAKSGNELKKMTISVFDINGRKVAYLKLDFSKNDDKATDIVAVTNNYIISRTLENKKFSYVLRNTKGKAKYSSSERINKVSNNFVAVKGNESYLLVDKNGKIIIDSIKKYNSFIDGKYISIKRDNERFIIDDKGNRILKNYSISSEVKNKEGKVKYLIVKNDSNRYYYFDIKKQEVLGSSFDSFIINDRNEVIVNKSNKKYLLKSKGKQVRYYGDINSIYEKISKKIDTDKYYLYRVGLQKAKQKYVFVNNKSDKSFGVLNVSDNDYTKLFDYSKEISVTGASLSEIGTEKDLIRITCANNYCDGTKNIIYNIKNNKKIYEDKNEDVIISEFTLYEDDYKVVRYSHSSSNTKYSGRTVLYDSSNKKVFSSSKSVGVVDKKSVFGNIRNNNMILYSISLNKKINDKTTLGSKLVVNENEFYKFEDKKKMVNVYSIDGNKIISIPSTSYLTTTNKYIVYLDDKDVLRIYNTDSKKTKTYKLKTNEKLNDEFGEVTSPYRGITFVNNSRDRYVKLVNDKGITIRKIRNAELSSVVKTEEGRAIIIVKSTEKNKDLFGLYIAK